MNVQVDFSQITGKMKRMHAVNNGPTISARGGRGNMDLYTDAGIPCCRNHDASFAPRYGGTHAHDVLNIFTDWDADENDPASYDFVLTDKTVREIYACGSTMLYRLGSKIEHEIKKYQTYPPKDFHKYARICEHIIRHYCYGWADGMKMPIEYWEIWNEADNFRVDGTNPCWQGTIEQFLEFYEVVAKHLKSCFPELKIGGPAYTGSNSRMKYMEQFISYAAEHNVPLDFFSWHGYRTDPKKYGESARQVKAMLTENGFANAELILNEWNYVRGWLGDEMRYSYDSISNEKGMAFDAAAMLVSQKSPMDMFMYYDARPGSGFNGMFKPWSFTVPLKGYYAFWQFNKLYQLQNEVFSDTDDPDLYVGAATKDGKSAVQIAYYSDEDLQEREVAVSLKGLKARTKVVILLADRDHENEKVLEMNVPAGDVGLVLNIKLHSSLLLMAETV